MKNHLSLLIALTMTIGYTPVISHAASPVTIHVAGSGSDTNSGTSVEKAVKTISAAISKVSTYQQAFKNTPINIEIHGGEYNLDNSISMSITGTQIAPVTIMASEGTEVIIKGSKELDSADFKAVTDGDVISKLPSGGENVYSMDISGYFADMEEMKNGGSGSRYPDYYRLIKNDNTQTLSRYPNEGYIKVADSDVVDKDNLIIKIPQEKAQLWAGVTDSISIHGFISANWGYSRSYIESVDSANSQMKISEVGHVSNDSGIIDEATYFVQNLIEELDCDGEYYIDRENKILYYYSEEQISEADSFELTSFNKPLFEVNNSSFVNFKGITFKNTRANGINVLNGNNITVDGCDFYNIGQTAVYGYEKSGVLKNINLKNNNVKNIGDVGFHLKSSGYTTLIPDNHTIENNYFEKTGQVARSYTGGVAASGHSMTIANNTLRDMPHSAINYSGINIDVVYNDIENVCRDCADMGAIYTGRSLIQRGNNVAFNRIVDVRSEWVFENLTTGVYLDDKMSGTAVHHNFIDGSKRGIFMNGGSDNSVHDNIIINCDSGISLGTGGNGETYRAELFEEAIAFVEANPQMLTEYPTLKYPDPEKTLPRGNFIYDNLVINSGCQIYEPNNYIKYGYTERLNRRINNRRVSSFADFTDSENGDYSIKQESFILNSIPRLADIDLTKTGHKTEFTGYTYTDNYKEELKNELIEKLDNLPESLDYSTCYMIDEIRELIELLEVNDVYVENIEGIEKYNKLVSENKVCANVPVNLSSLYNAAKISGNTQMSYGAGGYGYDSFINLPYWNNDADFTEKDTNKMTFNGITYEMSAVENGSKNDTLVSTMSDSPYTQIEVNPGYYETVEILANARRSTIDSQFLRIILKYSDGTEEAGIMPINYMTNQFVSDRQIKVARFSKTDAFAYIGQHSVKADRTKKLVAINVLNANYDFDNGKEYASYRTDELLRNDDGTLKIRELMHSTDKTLLETVEYNGRSINLYKLATGELPTSDNYASANAVIFAMTLTQNNDSLVKTQVLPIVEKIDALYAGGEVDYSKADEIDEIEKLIAEAEENGITKDMISNYNKLIKAKKRIECFVWTPVEPSLFVNASRIYSSGWVLTWNGYAAYLSQQPAMSSKQFKTQDIWQDEWTGTMTDNVLLHNGRKYKLRLRDGTSKNTVYRASSNLYDTIDVADGKYSALRILASRHNPYTWRNYDMTWAGVLVYSDGSEEYVETDIVAEVTNKNGAVVAVAKSKKDGSYEENSFYYMHEYELPVNPEKTLVSIKSLGESTNATRGSDGKYSFAKTTDIYTGSELIKHHQVTIYGMCFAKYEEPCVVSNISFYDNENMEVIDKFYEAENSFSVLMNVKVNENVTAKELFAALYDDSGRLVQVVNRPLDNKNMEIDAEFTVDREMNENWTVKVFVWNTKEGMNPIIDSVILR